MSVISRLNEADRRLQAGLERGIREVLHDAEAKATQRAPKDTGQLRQSGSASDVSSNAAETGGDVGFSEPYAVEQHEDLSYNHTDGEAKYLEKTMLERAREYQAHIARRMSEAGG